MPAEVYRFPRTKFVNTHTINSQITHVVSETSEVLEEFRNLTIRHDEMAIELLDLIHSAETALRILAERHAVNVPLAQEYVIEKNRIRGYYNTEE